MLCPECPHLLVTLIVPVEDGCRVYPEEYRSLNPKAPTASKETLGNPFRFQPDGSVYVCKPTTWEAEAGKLKGQGQSRQLSESLKRGNKKKSE